MIIDGHVHFGQKLVFNMPQEDVLTAMERYNIDYIIASNCEAAESDFEFNLLDEKYQTNQEECFEKAITFSRENIKKIGIAPWVKPHTSSVNKKFISLIKNNLDIVKAIKVHPYHSAIRFDDPKVEEYIKVAQDFDLPVITHTGNSDFDCCSRVFSMAKKYPNVKFILAHMGLGTDNTEAIDLISKLKNLYGDTTWVPIKSTIAFINKIGSERILFGSDMPIDGVDTYLHNKTGDRSLYQEYFYDLPKLISKADYDNLMYKNALSMFKINL